MYMLLVLRANQSNTPSCFTCRDLFEDTMARTLERIATVAEQTFHSVLPGCQTKTKAAGASAPLADSAGGQLMEQQQQRQQQQEPGWSSSSGTSRGQEAGSNGIERSQQLPAPPLTPEQRQSLRPLSALPAVRQADAGPHVEQLGAPPVGDVYPVVDEGEQDGQPEGQQAGAAGESPMSSTTPAAQSRTGTGGVEGSPRHVSIELQQRRPAAGGQQGPAGAAAGALRTPGGASEVVSVYAPLGTTGHKVLGRIYLRMLPAGLQVRPSSAGSVLMTAAEANCARLHSALASHMSTKPRSGGAEGNDNNPLPMKQIFERVHLPPLVVVPLPLQADAGIVAMLQLGAAPRYEYYPFHQPHRWSALCSCMPCSPSVLYSRATQAMQLRKEGPRPLPHVPARLQPIQACAGSRGMLRRFLSMPAAPTRLPQVPL